MVLTPVGGGGESSWSGPEMVVKPQGPISDFEVRDGSVNYSADELIARLSKDMKEGGDSGEIYLGMEKWLEEGIPNPISSLSNLKVDLINRLGCLNYHVRKLEVAPDGERLSEPYYQLVIKTAQPDLYILETYYPKSVGGNEAGTVTLSVKKDKPKMLEGVPAKIDFSARSMLDDLNTAVRRSMGNERLSEEFIEHVRKIEWISLDIDDCLTKTSEDGAVLAGQKLDEFAKHTRALNDVGVKIFINTGRGVADVEKIIARIEALGGKIDYAVCENGAVMYDRQAALKAKKDKEAGVKAYEIDSEITDMTMNVRNGIIKFLEENVVSKGYGMLEPGKVVGISVNGTGEGFQHAKGQVDVAAAAKAAGREIEDYKPIDIFKLWIVQLLNSEGSLKQIAEWAGGEVEQVWPLLRAIVSKIKNSATAVDINPCRVTADGQFVGIDKSRGTINFAEKMQILRGESGKYESIIGVGDSGGDLPAMREFATGAIPWNATIDLRENKDLNIIYFSPFETTEGINDILRVIFEAKKKALR